MQAGESLRSHTIRFMVFAVLAVLLLVLKPKQVEQFRSTLALASYPIQLLSDFPSRIGSTIGEYFFDRNNLLDVNKEMNRKLTEYSTKEQHFKSLEAENKRLRQLLSAPERPPHHYVSARILNIQSARYSRTVSISKGTNDGIVDGQVAVSGTGIYGQVISSTAVTSDVIQLTDTRHTIPVKNKRTGATALAVGTGYENEVRLNSISEIDEVKKGDIYVSSGLGQVFPADYPVATVRDITFNPSDSMTAVVATTTTDYKKIWELLLIIPLIPTDEGIQASADQSAAAEESK